MSNPEFYTTTIQIHDDLNGDKYLRITLSVGLYRTGVIAEIGTKKGMKTKNGVKVPNIEWRTLGQNVIDELYIEKIKS